ncbi:hypothetical protein ABFS82_10G011900 [Erythranthe guttata]|uniref:Uncharacterized protein n=1 Tax=Erythranthe guttata TaxID=4155 RepID=A0A022RNA2_ERYGU|nr:PREDICTED: nodulation-signaling pathway 2 protein-like [Erythranthe guttata]EYU41942.1 hypothetical protein MIMGU_mgv1a022683mg [Erythranthe guttata]|eukprot:XP_012831780.1 PREDICTED: nodulation-signaling pathway 2 protein-like [Erythranthe guttata]
MMQPELLLPSWPIFDFCEIDGFDFSSSFASPEEYSSEISSKSNLRNTFQDEFFDLENLGDEIHICSAMEEICEWINGDETEGNSSSPITIEEDEWSPSLCQESSRDSTLLPIHITDMSLVFPGDDVTVDDHLSLLHLLRAYGEAVENGEKKLSEVIVKSINNKSSPQGNTVERVAYNLFQSGESRGEFLREESIKNIEVAFNVLYQSLPNGRFAHFAANSAILESIPKDAVAIQIVDFDMGEGIQWPPLIEALSKGKVKLMKITSVKLEEESESTSSCWSFEGTKKRLLAHARQFGVALQIEERRIEDFASEMMVKSGEWVVYNCTVGLPHMVRRRSRRSVNEFLKVAKEMLANYGGILNIGDGEEVGESLNNFASYFANFVRHYQAVFESLEGNCPVYLAEARTAMERLFLAPFMCPLAWFQDWEEMRKSGVFREESSWLEGRKISQENLAEAKVMVNERESSYSVRIEKLRENEMVLQWKGTPLVRVSTWI